MGRRAGMVGVGVVAACPCLAMAKIDFVHLKLETLCNQTNPWPKQRHNNQGCGQKVAVGQSPQPVSRGVQGADPERSSSRYPGVHITLHLLLHIAAPNISPGFVISRPTPRTRLQQ
eukprot:4039108-Amphidinium_carterae.2